MMETMTKGNGAESSALAKVALSILGYIEEGEWVALALEMDLSGYGENFAEALADLDELIAMQLSFAQSKTDPGLIFKSAEPVYWTIYEREREPAEPVISVAGNPIS